MDAHTAKVLEFDKIKDIVLGYVRTHLGARKAREIRPARDTHEVQARLALTREYVQAYEQGYRLPVQGESPDAAPILARAATLGSRLTGLELHGVSWLCHTAALIRGSLRDSGGRWPGLEGVVRSLPDLTDLEALIVRSIEPTGLVRDEASPELWRLRAQVRELRQRIYDVMEAILRTSSAVQDDVVVQRDDRYVIPVRSGSQGLVKGVIHGHSGSGASVFVEPLSVIEHNNQLRMLLDAEREETGRILLALTERVRDELPALSAAAEAVGDLDLLAAFGAMGARTRASVPRVSEDLKLSLLHARHPLLSHAAPSAGGQEVISQSLTLDSATRMMIVSGPNSGGKTVLLKTVGLIGMMFQSGMPVPVHPDSSLPVFRSIQADIGDQQDLEAHLSTFAAHLKTIQRIMEEQEEPALVLLDELGGSTNPDEGSALGMAIADYFLGKDALALVTTHCEPLKVYAATTPGAVNGAMEFREGPTYRLIPGIPGSSNALTIAACLGFPDEVLARARSFRGEAGLMVERYLRELQERLSELEARAARLQEERRLAEAERRDLASRTRALEAERKALLGQVRAGGEGEIRRLLADLGRRSEEILQSVRDRAERDRLRGLVRERLASLARKTEETLDEALPAAVPAPAGDAAEEEPATGAPVEKGARVRVRELNIKGIVAAGPNRGGMVEIMAGGKRIALRADQCEVLEAEGPRPRGQVQVEFAARERDVPLEINLIGCTAEEALARADKFLDDAIIARVPRVRLIHGHGSGRLRKAIREWLKERPAIKDVSEAHQSEGGAGATIVTLDV